MYDHLLPFPQRTEEEFPPKESGSPRPTAGHQQWPRKGSWVQDGLWIQNGLNLVLWPSHHLQRQQEKTSQYEDHLRRKQTGSAGYHQPHLSGAVVLVYVQLKGRIMTVRLGDNLLPTQAEILLNSGPHLEINFSVFFFQSNTWEKMAKCINMSLGVFKYCSFGLGN